MTDDAGIERKLRYLAELGPDWGEGGEKAPSPEAIRAASVLLRSYSPGGDKDSHCDAFPGGDGEVVVLFRAGDAALHIFLEEDGTTTCMLSGPSAACHFKLELKRG